MKVIYKKTAFSLHSTYGYLPLISISYSIPVVEIALFSQDFMIGTLFMFVDVACYMQLGYYNQWEFHMWDSFSEVAGMICCWM